MRTQCAPDDLNIQVHQNREFKACVFFFFGKIREKEVDEIELIIAVTEEIALIITIAALTMLTLEITQDYIERRKKDGIQKNRKSEDR